MDWTAVGTWATALATTALVIVAIIAARYAYAASRAANETLRLESEPVLMAGIEAQAQAPDLKADVRLLDGDRLAFLPTATLGEVGTAFVSVRNVGRFAAMDVTVFLMAKDVLEKAKETKFPGLCKV